MVNNSPKNIPTPVNADAAITEIKEEKVIYENGSCDIQVTCTLNSSFSIINRSKRSHETNIKALARNNKVEEENSYTNAKKRKYSTDCDRRNIDDSLSQICNSTCFNGLESAVSYDLDDIITCESPENKEITMNNNMIKSKMLHSSPINSPNNNKELKLIRGSNNIKDTNIISKKYKKSSSKINSSVKRSKKKENKDDSNIHIELGNVLEELEAVEENDQISDIDKEKLKNIHIKLIHKVPPQHEIENCAGSRVPTYHETKLFKKYGPLRKGIFSQQEDKIINKNWEMFCKLHNWDKKNVNPFLSFKHKGKFYIQDFEERQKFLRFLANGLPWRTLHSVYWRFKNLHSNHVCKRYSPEEDKKILSYIHDGDKNTHNHKKFADLAKILKRTRHSVWLHYRYLMKKRSMEEHSNSLSQIQWTLPLINRYIKKLFKVTKCENIQELKNAVIPKAVWEKLQEKLNIDYKILRKFWVLQLHMQLFCPNPIYLNDIKIQLIEYMYGKGISDAKEIIWTNLTKYFDGMTSSFLNKTFSSLMKEFDVKKYKRRSFLDAIEYLYEKKITEIKEQKMDKYLPRLKYKNGKINFLNEGNINKPNTHIKAC